MDIIPAHLVPKMYNVENSPLSEDTKCVLPATDTIPAPMDTPAEYLPPDDVYPQDAVYAQPIPDPQPRYDHIPDDPMDNLRLHLAPTA